MNSSTPTSLNRELPGRWHIPGMALLGLGCLIPGTMVDILRFESLFGDDRISVLRGILSFAQSGDLLLALLLLAFSVAFPAAKLGMLLWVWFAPTSRGRRFRVVGWLELLGKWSMLDAFVSALLLGAVQLGILGEMELLSGIYLYLGAIILSLVATFWLAQATGIEHPIRSHRPSRWLIPISLLALAGHVVGLFLPMLTVSAGWFWENEYSFAGGVLVLLRSPDVILGVVLGLFVGLLPAARAMLLLIWRMRGRGTERWTRLLLLLDRWSMGDVFLLALLVVLSKLGKLAETEPMSGLWVLGGANLLGLVDSVLLQRRVENP